jgi:hypothetical protein
MSLKLRPLGVPASEPLPPSPFERGRLIDWDDFESASAKYEPNIVGTGTIARSTTNPLFGDFSLKLVTSAGVNDECYAAYSIHDIPTNKKIGSYMSFAAESLNTRIVWFLHYYTGSVRHTAGVSYETANGNLSYYDEDGAYQTIDTIPYNYTPFAGLPTYATMGLVADFKNKTYDRVSFLGNEFDLSSYDLHSAASADSLSLIANFSIIATFAAAQTAYFDRYRLREETLA